MMEDYSNMISRWTVLAVCAMLMAVVSTWTHGAEGNYTLLIQTSPPNGGVVSPGTGVLPMPIGQEIPLSAVPNSGYRFAYWLGDISAGDGPNAVVSIDSPKLIVAVFAREDFEEKLPGVGVIEGQGGGGGQNYIESPIQTPGAVSPATGYYDNGYPFTYPDIPQDEEKDDDIPVPGDIQEDDIPVPGDGEVPEPATILLVGLGSAVLVLNRKR